MLSDFIIFFKISVKHGQVLSVGIAWVLGLDGQELETGPQYEQCTITSTICWKWPSQKIMSMHIFLKISWNLLFAQ